MDDGEKIALVFGFIFWTLASFGIGWCTGNDVTTKSVRQNLCKAVYSNTNDYINCNAHSIDEVLKKISEVE